jgi:hypothetical protein
MPDVRKQVITGLVPPEVDEARIREAWPSVARSPGMASLGRKLTGTIVLAPLAWMIMALGYFGKVLPFLARRYTLTNRRLMIRRGLKATPALGKDFQSKPGEQIALAEIEDVRVKPDANSDFFRAADLEIVSGGQVVLTLRGVPEPEGFQQAVLNACNAWVPQRKRGPFIPASAVK